MPGVPDPYPSAQAVVNRNREALLAATGQGSPSLDQTRAANAALLSQDADVLAKDSDAPAFLQAHTHAL